MRNRSEKKAKKKKKNPGAVQLGSLGGRARAQKLSSEKKTEIAKKAAKARWAKSKGTVPDQVGGVRA